MSGADDANLDNPVSERPWLRSYPADLPATLEPRECHLLAHFRRAVAAGGEREAIRYFDGSLSFAELDAQSDAFAVWLIEQGVQRGDRVGIILQNVPHMIIALLATWKAAAIPAPGNPMYQQRELAKLFADYQPKAMVCHYDHAVTVQQALAEAGLTETGIATVAARDFQSAGPDDLLPANGDEKRSGEFDFRAICEARLGKRPPSVDIDGEEIGLLLYTSGTTGVPKGAMLRHSSIAWDSEVSALWLKLHRNSRILAIAPLFHITGFILHMGAAIACGCSMALLFRFRADTVLDFIRSYRPTNTIAAITAFNALMNTPGASQQDFASFEHAFSGGAPIAPALRKAIRDRLGLDLLPAYGMTETCGITHMTPAGTDVPVDEETGALAVGLPISSTDARIVGANGQPLPAGVHGEIWMRGPQIMKGYWNKPAETAETLHDGWMRSGDIGCMDEAGWFYVIDREKDMISASGFKVWPREVEDVLLEHHAVREAAVVGAPDPYRGETVVAYVSVAGESPASNADLILHCRQRLAAYKAPARVEVLDDLPKTATGKIQRALLREKAALAG